jgi:hypothetical protein
MTENEQIQEMAKDICGLNRECNVCRCASTCQARKYARRAYNAGYRKVERGEWLIGGGFFPLFSECGEKNNERRNFCPNCGADMRGE